MIIVANPKYDSVFNFLIEDSNVEKVIGNDKNKFLEKVFPEKKFERGEQLIQIEDLDDLEDYKIIARRLALAAVDKEVRKRMNMEDDAKHELDLWKEEYEMRIKNAEAKVRNAEVKVKNAEAKIEKEKRSIAKSMLSDGLPISTIAKYTGLSEEEIKTL